MHTCAHYSRARTEQWWIESHRPPMCSFPGSSQWCRSSEGSKATTGSQQHPSLWSWDLQPPPLPARPAFSGLRRIESYVLQLDSFFIYLPLMEYPRLYSLPKARYFYVLSRLICCSWYHDFTSNSPKRLNNIWSLCTWTVSWYILLLTVTFAAVDTLCIHFTRIL